MNKVITIDQDALMLGFGIIELPANCVVVISDGIANVESFRSTVSIGLLRIKERLNGCGGKRGKNFKYPPHLKLNEGDMFWSQKITKRYNLRFRELN